MKKATAFTAKLLLLTLCVIIADRSIGALLRHFYYRSSSGEQGRLTYSLDSTTAPILVLGSSKALRHYASPIITDSLGLDCYNTGKDKQGLFYSLAVLQATLHRYHPRIILLDFNPIGLVPSQAALDELSILLPYYWQHPEIRPVIDKRSPYERIKTRSLLYCYNSLAVQIAFSNLSHRRDTGSIAGYTPVYPSMRNPPFSPYNTRLIKDPPDTTLVNALLQIITLTRENGCRLAVIVSPTYFPLPDSPSTMIRTKKICDSLQVPLLDYSASTAFPGNKPIFFDNQHLNDSGARIFTRLLCHDLITMGIPKDLPQKKNE
jgi:hypothetical protein